MVFRREDTDIHTYPLFPKHISGFFTHMDGGGVGWAAGGGRIRRTLSDGSGEKRLVGGDPYIHYLQYLTYLKVP